MVSPSMLSFLWGGPSWTLLAVQQPGTEPGTDAQPQTQAPLPSGSATRAPSEASRAEAQKKAAGCTTAAQLQHVINTQLDEQTKVETPAELFLAGHAATETVYQTGLQLTNLAAQGIAGASELAGAGRLVNFGTISKRGERYVYSSTPRDRLIVPGEDGQVVEFKFHEMQGSMQSAEAFFAGRHRMRFEATVKDTLDLEISSSRRGEHREAAAEGTLIVDGRSYAVDLEFDGVDVKETEVQGIQGAKSYKITGTVAHEDAQLTINERYTAQEATAEKRDGLSLGGHALSSQRTIDNTLKVGEDTYVWKDVRVGESFRNGRPSAIDSYWRAEGSLSRNGEPFGRYRLDADSDDVRVILQAGERSIELESFER